MEVLQENKKKVLEEFNQGSVTYIDLSSWTFADRFMAFLLSIEFFGYAARSYPSPRVKEEVPRWVLICCALQMKLHSTSSFSRLPGILGSGAILSRLGYNVADNPGGGFNWSGLVGPLQLLDSSYTIPEIRPIFPIMDRVLAFLSGPYRLFVFS